MQISRRLSNLLFLLDAKNIELALLRLKILFRFGIVKT